MKLFRSAATTAAALFVASTMTAQDPGESRLEIRRIVLYKHGIGYFEREGSVQGNTTVPLSFKSAQMKDVLKSLYAIDLNGGRIANILYDSKDPIQKQLEDILFRVPDGSALTQFLAQLKGARVRATVGNRAVSGNVLGVEPVEHKVQDGVIRTHKLVLLREDSAIVAVELMDASQIEILDETVRRDLARMMDIYAKARYADRKTVSLRAEGDGERRIRVGYIIETPIWKTSYRLLLDESAAPLLQGWAIVENRTDEDWNEVQLSFVAGSPQSFVLDLYTSYYPQRPVIGMGEGLAQEPAMEPEAAPMRKSRRMRAENDFALEAPAAAGTPGLGEMMELSNTVAAEGVTVGDLFAYNASGPVTIRQGQAALVPILMERLPKSERVLYYRRDRSPHAQHAMLLNNTTDLTLEKGPITVFEGSTCLGEALLPQTLKSGMHEIITYAFETAVEIEPVGDSRAHPVNRGVLADGVLTLTYTQELSHRYKLRNKSGKDYVLYLDHARAHGDFRLVEPAKPVEEVPGHLRFKVGLAAGAETTFTVREHQQVSSQVSILNQHVDQIRLYLQQKILSDGARAFLEKIAGLMGQRAELERQSQAYEAERNRLLQDQQTIRNNMSALRDSPEERKLRDNYVARLSRALERSDELEQLMAAAAAQRAQLDQRLAQEVRAYRD